MTFYYVQAKIFEQGKQFTNNFKALAIQRGVAPPKVYIAITSGLVP